MEPEQVCLLPTNLSGGPEMIQGELWHEIHSRFKLKESKKSIAHSLGVDVRTVRKILKQKHFQRYQRKKTGSTLLTGFEDFIPKRLPAIGYCAQSLFEELREQGYSGSYDTVRKFIQPLRQDALQEATVRFETPPGKQGQADWGQCWLQIAGRRTRVHLFVLTLGYSRRTFAQATLDEKLPTFLRCHEQAFGHFGGIPHEVLYDNLKSVVLSRDFEGQKIDWNPTFWDFSRYYGFRPRAHRPYQPQTKGKVESGIKYVKRFLRGKSFESLEHLNTVLLNWLTTTADQRVHGTTHQKPADRFAAEKDLLLTYPDRAPYLIQERVVRQVSRDCLVAFETNRYSVPFRWVGKAVEVQSDPEAVRIYHDGQLIGVHPRCPGNYQLQLDQAHYHGLWDRKPTGSTKPDYLPDSRAFEVQVRDLSFYESLVAGGAQ